MRSPLLAVLVLAACASRDQAPSPAEKPATAEKPAPDAAVTTTGLIHRGDTALTLIGKPLDVGDRMPDVTLAGGKLEPVSLASLKGKLVVLSVVPSIDTRVCEAQTHAVSEAMARMPDGTAVYTISRDLPFAQTRFAEEAMTRTAFASDYHGGAFGRAFGLEVVETGLLARSVWVIAPDGTIAYRELVDDQGTEPDYDALLAAVARTSRGG